MLGKKKWRRSGAIRQEHRGSSHLRSSVSVLKASDDKDLSCELFFYTENGMVKRSSFAEYNLSKSSFSAIGLKDGDSLIKVEKVMEDTTIFFGTQNGMCLYAETTDIPLQGRPAGGVKGMNIDSGDKVIGAFQSDGEGEIVVVTEQGVGKRVICATLDVSARYRKGVKMSDPKLGKVLLYSYVKTPYEIGMVDSLGSVHGVYTEDIEIVEDRTKKGKSVVKIKNIKLESACVHYGKLD